MYRYILFLACTLLASCATMKNAAGGGTDSVRVVTRYVRVFVPDTVSYQLPPQRSVRQTADSASHLENDYSTSDARIMPDGSLYHDLNTKDGAIQLPVMKEVERKDSIHYVYVKTPVPHKVPVYVEKELTWWQQTQMKCFWFFGLLLMFRVLWRVRKPLLSLLGKVPP